MRFALLIFLVISSIATVAKAEGPSFSYKWTPYRLRPELAGSPYFWGGHGAYYIRLKIMSGLNPLITIESPFMELRQELLAPSQLQYSAHTDTPINTVAFSTPAEVHIPWDQLIKSVNAQLSQDSSAIAVPDLLQSGLVEIEIWIKFMLFPDHLEKRFVTPLSNLLAQKSGFFSEETFKAGIPLWAVGFQALDGSIGDVIPMQVTGAYIHPSEDQQIGELAQILKIPADKLKPLLTSKSTMARIVAASAGSRLTEDRLSSYFVSAILPRLRVREKTAKIRDELKSAKDEDEWQERERERYRQRNERYMGISGVKILSQSIHVGTSSSRKVFLGD